jgi:hypothetical protein
VTGSYFVAIPDLKTRKLAHFKVPYDVYVYIKQLEHVVEAKLKDIYWRDET